MSLSAQYHAQQWAEGKTPAQLAERIAQLEAMPEWKGVEFDDIRVRHKRLTEIKTLRALLEA